mmetsp:Transcript_18540/g.52074  ORF Transcript_18540/g.52074 Transcript_18540/m.52074 type:complete len:97 (+) Transcript_18540:356-646(+)
MSKSMLPCMQSTRGAGETFMHAHNKTLFSQGPTELLALTKHRRHNSLAPSTPLLCPPQQLLHKPSFCQAYTSCNNDYYMAKTGGSSGHTHPSHIHD